MSTPEAEGDFAFYLRFVKPLVLNLTEPNDRALAAAWVQKLREETAGTEELRTDYLKLLLFVLQRKKLIGVFSENPNQYEVLEKFPETNLHDVARELLEAEEDCRRQQNLGKAGGDFPPYSTEHSADLLEYSAAQDIPNFGVHAYYAISNEPLPKWERIEKAVFPRGVASTTDRNIRSDVLSRTSSTTSEPTRGDAERKAKRRKLKKKKDISFDLDDKPDDKPDGKDHGRGFDGGKTSPRRKSYDGEPPSPSMGSKVADEFDRHAPTWGSNLIGVTELPVRDIPTESAEELSEQGSSESTLPSLPYRTPSPRKPDSTCRPCTPSQQSQPPSPYYSPGTPPRQYSPGLPEGGQDLSVFFLESPPPFLEDTSLAAISPVRKSPSPKQVVAAQIGAREYDLNELKDLGLDASALGSDVFNLDNLEDFDDQEEFEADRSLAEPVVPRSAIDDDLDAFDRMIAEYEKDDFVPPPLPTSPPRSPPAKEKPSKKVVTRKKTIKKTDSRSGKQQPVKSTTRLATKTTTSTAPASSAKGATRISAPGASRIPGASASRIAAPGSGIPGASSSRIAAPTSRLPGATTSRIAAPTSRLPGASTSRIAAPGSGIPGASSSRIGGPTSRLPGAATSRIAAPTSRFPGASTSRIAAPGSGIPGASSSRIGAPTSRLPGASTSRIAAPSSGIPGASSSRIAAPTSRLPGASASRIAAPSGSRIPGTTASRISAPGGSRSGIPAPGGSRIPGASASRIAAPSGSRIAVPGGSQMPRPVSRIPSRGIPQQAVPTTPPRPYSPGLPEGGQDLSPFFWESPPSYFERSTPESITMDDDTPSWPIQTPPQPSYGSRNMADLSAASLPYRTPPRGYTDMADLSAASLPYRTPPPRVRPESPASYGSRNMADLSAASLPYRTPPRAYTDMADLSAPSIPYRTPPPRAARPGEFNIEELKELGLDEADLADLEDVFNLEGLEDVKASDMSSISNLEYEDRPEFDLNDDEINREFDEWTRKIAELEAEHAEDIALYGSPDRSPVRTLGVEAVSPGRAAGEEHGHVNTLVAVPGDTEVPERDEGPYPYDDTPSLPIRTPSPKRSPRASPGGVLPPPVRTLSVVAPPPSVDAASMTIQEIVESVSEPPSQQTSRIPSQQSSRISATASSRIPAPGGAPSASRIPPPGASRIAVPGGSRIPGASSSRISAPSASRIPGASASRIAAPGGSRIPGASSSRIAAPSASRIPGASASRIAVPGGSRIPGVSSSRIAAPSGSRIPGSTASRISAPGGSRSGIPAPGGSRIPGASASRIAAPSGSRIAVPGGSQMPRPVSRIPSRGIPQQAAPATPPRPYSPGLPEGGQELSPFFWESPPSYFERSTPESITMDDDTPSWPIQTPPQPSYGSRNMADLSAASLPYRTPSPRGRPASPAEQLGYDLEELKRLGLEAGDLDDLEGIEDANLSKISVTSQVDYEYSPEFDLQDEEINREFDEWTRKIAELEAEHAEDIALYGSPEAKSPKSPKVTFPDSPGRSPARRSPQNQLVAEAAPPFIQSGSPAAQDIVDSVNRQHGQLVQERLFPASPLRSPGRDLEEQERLAIAAQAQLGSPASGVSDLDSFERMERECGVVDEYYAGAAAPIPMPPELDDVQTAEELAYQQYQQLKRAELEDEYRRRYKHRRPDMPRTPPMFSKYAAVMGDEEREYEPAEFGEIGDNEWQSAEQFFEEKKSLSPRPTTDVRGYSTKQFFRGIQRQPEEETFFEQETEPELMDVDLEFETSTVEERSPVATEQDKAKMMADAERDSAAKKETIPAEGGLPVTVPHSSPSPRRPHRSIRVETEAGDVSFEMPSFEEDIFSSTRQGEPLLFESPAPELYESPPKPISPPQQRTPPKRRTPPQNIPAESPPESPNTLRVRLLTVEEPADYSKEQWHVAKGRTSGKFHAVKRSSSPPGLHSLREVEGDYPEENVPFLAQVEGAQPFQKPTRRIRVAHPSVETVHERPMKVPAFIDLDHLEGLRSIVRELEETHAGLPEEGSPLPPQDLFGVKGHADWKESSDILDRSLTEDLPSPIRPPATVPGWKTPPHLVIPITSTQRKVLPDPTENVSVHPDRRDIITQEIPPWGMMYSPPQLLPGEHPVPRPTSPQAPSSRPPSPQGPSPRTPSPQAPFPRSPSPRAPSPPTLSPLSTSPTHPTIFDFNLSDDWLAEEAPPEGVFSPVRTPPQAEQPPMGSPQESPFYLRLRLLQAGEPAYYSREEMEIPAGRTYGSRRLMKRKSSPPSLHTLREVDADYAEENVPFLAQVESRARPFPRPTRRLRVVAPGVDTVLESPVKVLEFTEADRLAGVRRAVADIEQQYADLLEEIPDVLPEDLINTSAPTEWIDSYSILDTSVTEDLPSPARPPTIVPGWKTPPRLVTPARPPRRPLIPGAAENIRVPPGERNIIVQELPPAGMMHSPPPLSPGDYPPARPPMVQPSPRAPSPRAPSPQAPSPRAPSPRVPSPRTPSPIALSPLGLSPQGPSIFDAVLEDDWLGEEAAPEGVFSPVKTPPRPPSPPRPEGSPLSSPESPFYVRLRVLQAGEPDYYSREEMEIPVGGTYGRRRLMKRKSSPPGLHSLREVEDDYSEEHAPFLAQVEGAQPFWRPTRRMRVVSPEFDTVHERPIDVPPFTTADHLAAMRRHVEEIQRRHPPPPKTPPEDLMGAEGPVDWQESPGIFDRSIPDDLRSPIRPPTVVPGWETPPQYKVLPKSQAPHQFQLIPSLKDPLFYEMPPEDLGYSPPGRIPTPEPFIPRAPSPPRRPASPPPQFRTTEDLFGDVLFEQEPKYVDLEMPPDELVPPSTPDKKTPVDYHYKWLHNEPVTTPPHYPYGPPPSPATLMKSPCNRYWQFRSPANPSWQLRSPYPGADASPTWQYRSPRPGASPEWGFRSPPSWEVASPLGPTYPEPDPSRGRELEEMAKKIHQKYDALLETEEEDFEKLVKANLENANQRTGGKVGKQSSTLLERVSAIIHDVPDTHLPRARPLYYSPAKSQASPEWSPELPKIQKYADQIAEEFVPPGVWGYKSPKTPPPSPERPALPERPPAPKDSGTIFDVEAVDDDFLEQVLPPELVRSPTSPPIIPRIDDYYAPHTPPSSPESPNRFIESVKSHEYTNRFYDVDRRLMTDQIRVKNKVVSLSARKSPRVSPIKEAFRESPPHVPVEKLLPVELFPPEYEEEMQNVQDDRSFLDRAVPQVNLPLGMADPEMKMFESPPRPPKRPTPNKFVYVPGAEYHDELMFQTVPPDLYYSPERDIFEETQGPGVLEFTPPPGVYTSPPPLSPQGSPYSPFLEFTPPSSTPFPKQSPCQPCSPRASRRQHPMSPPISPSFSRSVQEHAYTPGFFDPDRPKAQNILRIKNRATPLRRHAPTPRLEFVEEYDEEDVPYESPGREASPYREASPCREDSPCRAPAGSPNLQLPMPVYYGSPGRMYVRTPTRRADDPWADPDASPELGDDDVYAEENINLTRTPFEGQTGPEIMDTSFIDPDLNESFVEEEMSGFKWLG